MNYFETISYDSETGVFCWAVGRPGCSKGAIAGHINTEGYRVIKLGRNAFLAHRLAWFLVHGEWPSLPLDHINGVRDDNRLQNLRMADHSINMQNKRAAMSNNKSCGLLGVTWNKQHGRWQSKIMVRGVRHHVGLFDSAEDAHRAYLKKKRQLHEGCTI